MAIIRNFSEYSSGKKISTKLTNKKDSKKIESDNNISPDEINNDDIKMNVNILSQERVDKDISDNKEVIKNNTKKKAIPMDTSDIQNKQNENIKVYGKIAKFPKNTKANVAYDYLKNLKNPKLSKNDIWYIMLEKQGFDDNGNELQMIKYDQKKGVNLSKFLIELKGYYSKKFADNPKLVEAISKIELCGDKDGLCASIKNIPDIKIEDKKLVTKITSDLINLLHK